MLVRQVVDEILAQYAYLIGCPRTGEAIVIDPERDVDRYFELAAHHRLRIVAAADTHIHADYLTGLREMAERGVLVYASKPRALYKMFPQSIEVQMESGNAGDFWCIQENIEVKDMEKRRPREKGEKWGGSEGDARRIVNLTDGSEKPLGQWNSMIIEARGRSLKVWVNGDLVNDGFGATADRGKIALQAEGVEVEFRKVQIGPLPAATP